MDSSESPVHGQQEGAAYNGHFECVCYHPLFLFNQFGDCEAAKLRSGNAHSADDWQEVLDPVVERYLTAAVRLLFRADAAFAKPEIYDYLEARNIGYAIRLRSNQVLQREIAPRLIRPTEWLSPSPSSPIMTSSTRPRAGTLLGEWSLRWSGTRENCFPEWASSSPI